MRPRAEAGRGESASRTGESSPSGLGAANAGTEPGLACGGGVSGQVRRVLRAYHGQSRRYAAADAGNAYLAEQHRGAGRGIAELGHPERVLRRQRRQRGQQAGVHIACPQLCGARPGEPDARVPEQLASGRPARGEAGQQRGAVGGRPAGLTARTSIRVRPEPKLAISAGAYNWPASRPPAGGRSPARPRGAGWPPRTAAASAGPRRRPVPAAPRTCRGRSHATIASPLT